jgi:hypothetical protein
VNVSVLLLGQPRIVHPDGRLSAEKLRAALGRAGEELAMIRLAVSRLVAPDIPLPRPARVRELGPER